MFIFQAAELLAVTLLSPGNLPENLQTSKPVRKSSSYLQDMISFWGTLLSVISQQQLKANNYNLLVTPVTFFSLVLNGSPLTLNANFTKKKIYFSEFVFFWKQELCFFQLVVSKLFFLKRTWLTCWRRSQAQAKCRRAKPVQVPALQCTSLSQGLTHFIPWAPGGLRFAHGAQHLIHMAIL